MPPSRNEAVARGARAEGGTRASAIGLRVLLLLGALASGVQASPAPISEALPGRPSAGASELQASADAQREVVSIVERGIELRRAARDAEALEVFRLAYGLAPGSARVRFHLAATHQALGQWLEAEPLLRQLLLEGADPYVRRNRANMEQSYAAIAERVGQLEVVGTPLGAEVSLGGRSLGTLPMREPVRVLAGSYVLEVRRQGYYPSERRVTIAGRALVRESIELRPSGAAAPGPVAQPAAAPAPEAVARTSWLRWGLAGVGTAAALTGGVAWWLREHHAARWNARDCLAPGRTRADVCSGERDAGRRAERIAVASGAAAGLFWGAAALSYSFGSERADVAAHATRCGIGWLGFDCQGSF